MWDIKFEKEIASGVEVYVVYYNYMEGNIRKTGRASVRRRP